MKTSKGPSNTLKLIIAILICEVTGILSGFLSNSGRGPWFDSLVKPEWNPPSSVFGPVWTILYLLMGISLWLVWKSNAPEPQKKQAMWLFAFQLFLNFWWSMIFFKFHAIGLAFAEIIMMWVLILFTIIYFSKISKPAAWLLVPYIAWVSFASILNYAIWMLNK